jgi:hypothetical protein
VKIVGIDTPARCAFRNYPCLTYSTSVKKSFLLLASGASLYMTGSVITVVGGILLT